MPTMITKTMINDFKTMSRPRRDRIFYDRFKEVHQSELREDVVRQLEEKMANLEECINWRAHAHGIRNIEDFAMKRMRKALKIPAKTQVKHATIVDRFIINILPSTLFPSSPSQISSLSNRLNLEPMRTAHFTSISSTTKRK